MGIWSSLFGSNDNAGKIIDGIKEAGDKLIYTDEEKDDTNIKGFQLWIKYQEATMGQNIARRLIAMIVVGMWAVVAIICVFGIVLNLGYRAELVQFMQSIINPASGLVLTFYYVKRFIKNG